MLISTFYFVFFYQEIVSVFSWGRVGHNLIAHLAQSQLDSSTNNWIQNYIPRNLSGDLSAIASWADMTVDPNTNSLGPKNWLWSRELHVALTPDWSCEYISSRDCLNNRCLEGALKNYSQRLIDNNYDYVQQQQALFFLVHFVGDAHQPLHAGFKGDVGGKNITGFFFDGIHTTDLHEIWDSGIINIHLHRHFQLDINLYYQYLKSLMFNQSLLINETYNDYKKWIDESIDYVCKQVYFDDNNDKLDVSRNFILGEKYFNRNWPLIDQRLTQAGRRLASLLNQLDKNRSSKKLPSNILTHIIVLCIVLSLGIIVSLSVYLYRRHRKGQYDAMTSE
ncbi:unnamed protein product [Rotaria sp. Silwood1]|nr:unnamed protein product [Rotaria sp. Silwood1]CAF4770113.1 unnamed protein product [Rotaria sp. Silwood1]